MTSLKLVRKRHQQLPSALYEKLSCILFLSSGRKKMVKKACFPSIFKVQTAFLPISRPDKLAMLLKIYFKPLIKQLKFSTLVAKYDLRFKIR